MNDRDKTLYILNKLGVDYSDYYRPDEKCDIQIFDEDFFVIGIITFDADGNFESCDRCY